MKISLVTGGAGFIGSHVVKHCLSMGQKVVVLDDLSGGFEDQVSNEAIFVKGSITDVELLASLFNEYNFNYVYHLAAYAAEGLSHFIRRFNYNNNLIGSVNLINESVKHKVEHFVFTSSIACYGHIQPPFVETQQPQPVDPYAIAKYAVEQDLYAAKTIWPDFNYTIFRPHNVYGENQNIGDKYRNVIGIFMNQIMLGLPLTVFGDGEQTRAFSYIDDVAIPIAQCVNIPGANHEAFNIGGDTAYSINQLIKVVAEAFDEIPKVKYLKARNEAVHAHSDHKKAKAIFGEPTGITLNEGVKRMAEWAKVVGARESAEFDNIEVAENLPESWEILTK